MQQVRIASAARRLRTWTAALIVLRVVQETLDALRKAMANTRIMCAVMLDTKVQCRGQSRAAVSCPCGQVYLLAPNYIPQALRLGTEGMPPSWH